MEYIIKTLIKDKYAKKNDKTELLTLKNRKQRKFLINTKIAGHNSH